MFSFTLLELFIIFCVGVSFITLSDIIINVVKDVKEEDNT